MSTQHGKSAAAHHMPSRHDDITSGCNQTGSYQGGAAAAPTNNRDKSASGTYTRISQSWSQRVRSYRRASKRMITRDWFDQAVVGLILVNCIFLALDDPTMESPPSWQLYADIVFTVLFALEMSLKLAALGLRLYFKDAWNWLDAIVVVEGIFSVFYDGGVSVKSLRVLRVLRPLRTVRRMPRVQLVVTSLLRAGWTLGRIVCIFLVWLTIFAIMGVLLWSGKLDMRCASEVSTSSTSAGSGAAGEGGVCGEAEVDQEDLSAFCSSLELLDSPYTCEEGESCEYYGSSPFSGMVNFDNLLWSLLTLFTVTTLEGWHEVMMFTQRVMSEYTIWFFVSLIVTATWAIMSLMIAAMLARFKAVSLAAERRLQQEKVQARRARDRMSIGGPNYLFDAAANLVRGAEGVKGVIAKGGAEVGGAIVRGGADILAAGPNRAAGLINAHVESYEYWNLSCDGLLLLQITRSKPGGKTARIVGQATELRSCLGHPRVEMAVISQDSMFTQVILWAIVLNVVVIGMGGYDVGQQKAQVLSDIEMALTILFCAEALFKNSVLGARRYFKSRWNRFDFFVTLTSLVHLLLTVLVDDLTATSTLRLLNVLRVFRILRMRRLKRTVMTVVGVVIKSARDLWPVVALMLLMCFVFTVLGMQLFGATLNPDLEAYAENAYAFKTRFDTFFWSFVQVFTVIAGDSWNTIMYRTMENTSSVSAVFFVALIVLGESVLLNLVLAVVLEGASDQMKEKYAAQQFRQSTLKLFHNQYKRLALRRWHAKLQAAAMLRRGQVLLLPEATLDLLGLVDFPRPSQYQPGFTSSTSSSSLALHPQPTHAASFRPLRRDLSPAASASSLTRRDDNLTRKRPPFSTYAVAGLARERSTATATAAGAAGAAAVANAEAQDENGGSFGRIKESVAFPAPLTETHSDGQWERRWDEGWGQEEGRMSRRASLGHGTSKKSGNKRNRLELRNTPGEKREDEHQPSRLREEEKEEEVDGRRRSTGVGPHQRRAPMLARLVGKRWRAGAEPGRGFPPAGHIFGDDVANSDARGDGSGCEQEGPGWGQVRGEEGELAQGGLGVQQGVSTARDNALKELPQALYGVFSDMMTKKETSKWWHKLDRIFGTRVDESVWDRKHFQPSPVRKWCGRVVGARHFEPVMLGFVLSSIVLSMFQTDDLTSATGVLDTLCLFAFFLELCLRAGALSWWMGPSAVLRDSWALLDVYLVASHGVTTAATILGLAGMSRVNRVLRTARPLRIVHRIKSLQEISEALVHSLRSCGTLLVLITTLLFGYSIVGMEVFGGMFYSCSDPDFAPKSYRYGEYDSEEGAWTSPPCSGVWVNPATGNEETRDFEWANNVYHFDSLAPALLSTMMVTTLDGWVEIFHKATDAYKVDYQPSQNCNVKAFWYFFAGIIVFGFYIANLFVGVMFEAFLSYKNINSSGGLISQAERRWRDYEKRLYQVVPVVAPCSCADRPWRARIQRMVLSTCFNNWVVGVLVVNAIVLAVDHSDAPDWQLVAQEIFNIVFACIFVVETCFVMVGLGPRCYFSTGRQTFEFVVTIASVADLAVDVSGACSGGDIVILRLVRSLRVVRIIRLATHIPGFDQILAACTYPAHVLANVFVLLTIGVYVFANVGVALFSDVVIPTTTMDLYQDFSSVWRAMQLLFIVATGEAWADYASKIVDGSDLPDVFIKAFFVVFVVIMQFILTNLFIMVIVETFETLNARERQDLEGAIPHFQKLWSTFDPCGTGKLPPKHLHQFLMQLENPLGAAGNHASAGWYVTMLRSGPDFDHSFTKILVGLGAALLSDEKRKTSYRPINNLRKVMATLVIQRALKRNWTRKKGGKVHLCDVVIAAEKQAGSARRATRTRTELSPPEKGYRPAEPRGGISRSQPGYRDRVLEAKNVVRLPERTHSGFVGRQAMVERPRTAAGRLGAVGSIGLPPDAEESTWLMRKFLMDLQQMNEEDDSIGQVLPTGGAVRKEATTVAAAGGPESAPLNLPARPRGGGGHSGRGVGVGPLTQRRDVTTAAAVAEGKRNQGTTVASSNRAIQNAPATANTSSNNRGGLHGGRDDSDIAGRGGDREPVLEENPIAGWFRSMFSQVWSGDEPGDTLVDSGRNDTETEEQRHRRPDRLRIDVPGPNDSSICFDEERAAPGEEKVEVVANAVPISPLAMWLKDQSAF